MKTPALTVVSASVNKVSQITGMDTCTIVFSCDIDLQAFQVRATRSGDPRGVGVGDLLYSTGSVTAGGSITVTIDGDDITQGDGDYVISLWGKAADGYFDFGDLDFDNVDFGEEGGWNS